MDNDSIEYIINKTTEKLDKLNTMYSTNKDIKFFNITLQNIFKINKISITFNTLLDDDFTKKIKILYYKHPTSITNFENEFNTLMYVFNFDDIILSSDTSTTTIKMDSYSITKSTLYKAIISINQLINTLIKNDEFNEINEKYLKLFEKYYKIVSKLYNNDYVMKTNFMIQFKKGDTKYFMLDFYIIEYLILKYTVEKYDYLKQILNNLQKYNSIINFFLDKTKYKSKDGYSANIDTISDYIKQLKIIYYDNLTEDSTLNTDEKIKFMNNFLINDEKYRENIISKFNEILFSKKIKELCSKVNKINVLNLDKHDCENINPYIFLESFKKLCILLKNYDTKYYNIFNDIIKFINENIDKYADILKNLSNTKKQNIIEWTNKLESLYKKLQK